MEENCMDKAKWHKRLSFYQRTLYIIAHLAFKGATAEDQLGVRVTIQAPAFVLIGKKQRFRTPTRVTAFVNLPVLLPPMVLPNLRMAILEAVAIGALLAVGVGQSVKSVSVRNAPTALYGLGLNFTDTSGIYHGGSQGTLMTLPLNTGECIKALVVHVGARTPSSKKSINYMKFVRNSGRTLEGGATTSATATVTAPSGYQITGFKGTSSNQLNSLAIMFTRLPLP
ncbi:hypothetical protein FI667_g4800, partial [Globisporangium splendens]